MIAFASSTDDLMMTTAGTVSSTISSVGIRRPRCPIGKKRGSAAAGDANLGALRREIIGRPRAIEAEMKIKADGVTCRNRHNGAIEYRVGAAWLTTGELSALTGFSQAAIYQRALRGLRGEDLAAPHRLRRCDARPSFPSPARRP